jgi:hypothetical protein
MVDREAIRLRWEASWVTQSGLLQGEQMSLGGAGGLFTDMTLYLVARTVTSVSAMSLRNCTRDSLFRFGRNPSSSIARIYSSQSFSGERR